MESLWTYQYVENWQMFFQADYMAWRIRCGEKRHIALQSWDWARRNAAIEAGRNTGQIGVWQCIYKGWAWRAPSEFREFVQYQ